MIDINLLPWRDRKRDLDAQKFNILLITIALASILLTFSWYLAVNQSINAQRIRNTFINHEISLTNASISSINTAQKERETTIEKLRFFINNKIDQYEIIKLLNNIVALKPKDLTITRFAQDNKKFIIEGEAVSNSSITEFLGKLSKNKDLVSPELNELSRPMTENKRPVIIFKIILNTKNTDLKGEDDGRKSK